MCVLRYTSYMKLSDKYSKRDFPLIIILASVIAFALVYVLHDPLTQLRTIFVDQNLILTSVIFTIILSASVIVSPFTIAPAVPFVAKILSPPVTFILTIVGWTIGSVVAYLVARYGGKDLISKVYPSNRLDHTKYAFSKSPGFFALLQTRLFSQLDNFSYFVGLYTQTSFARFLVVTIVGAFPAAFIFSYSADVFTSGDDLLLFSLMFAIALIALAFVAMRGLNYFEKPARVIVEEKYFNAGEIIAVAALMIFFENRRKKYKIEFSSDIDKRADKHRNHEPGEEVYILGEKLVPREINNIFGAFGNEAGVRGNNIPYGVFGLVWKKYGAGIAGTDALAKDVEQDIVWGVDAEEFGIKQELDAGVFIEQWSLPEIVEKTFTDGSGKTKKVKVKLFPWEELNYVAKVKKAFKI